MSSFQPQLRSHDRNAPRQMTQLIERKNLKTQVNYQKQIEDFIYFQDDQIGTGQFSTVFSGNHVVTKEKVAIKVVEMRKVTEPLFLNLMQNEIAILQMLKHKNLLLLKGVYSTTNNVYIITEFCNQGDLSEIIKKDKYIPEYRAIKIMKHLVHGLIKLEKHEIIHRDIKPANILVSEGVPKFADFGFAISKQLSLVQKNSFEGLSVGTPLYMAPETLLQNHYNTKTDLWALGCVFYEMLFGQVPFHTFQHQDLVYKIQQYSRDNKLLFPQNLQKVSQQSIDLIKSLLVCDPAKRITLNEMTELPIFDDNLNLKIIRLKRQTTCVLSPSPLKQGRFESGEKKVNKFEFDLGSGEKTSNPLIVKKVGLVQPRFLYDSVLESNQKSAYPGSLNISTANKSDADTQVPSITKLDSNLAEQNSYGKITRKDIKITPKTLLFDTNASNFCKYIDSVIIRIHQDSLFTEIEFQVQKRNHEKCLDLDQIRYLKDKLLYLAAKMQFIIYSQYGVVQKMLDKYQNQLQEITLEGDIIQDKLFSKIFNNDHSINQTFFTTLSQYLKICILCINKYLMKHLLQLEKIIPYKIQQSIILLDYVVITYQFVQLFLKDFHDFAAFCKSSQIDRFIDLKPDSNISFGHFIDIKKKIENLRLN